MPSASEVRASHPLSLRHLGEGFLQEYVEKSGGLPFADYVTARFARGTIPDRAARDLARYEAERARLLALPPLAPQEGPLPDDAPLRLSPDVALVNYGADLPGVLAALRESLPATPRPRRAWLLLLPRGGDVEERDVDRDGGWTLEAFREPQALRDLGDPEEEREGIEALWKEGVLVRA